MTQKELFKIVNLIKNEHHINPNDYELMWKIRDGILDGSIKVLRKEWGEKFRNDRPEIYPFDFSQIDLWRTYKECVDYDFYVKGKKFYCNLRVEDGDNFFNHNSFRFTLKLELPNKFILNIASYLEGKLNRYLADKYKEFLKEQAEIWMSNLKETLLKD